MNKINIEKVIDYSNILKENEKLKLEIERLNNIINKIKEELEAYIRLCVDVNANDILDMIEHYTKGDK